MNENSLKNLKPFTGANDPRRQNGRRKGSVNRRTVIKKLLSQNIEPDKLFSAETRSRFKGLNDKSYLEAITLTLANQALNGETRASDIMLRELRDIENREVPESLQQPDIEIKVVQSRDELERLNDIESRLESKYGEDYENLLE